MTDIFISYANSDRPRVGPLVVALQHKGWSVWWDRAILGGKIFDKAIETALSGARCVIVLWSHNSIASDWVRSEAELARRRNLLVPALLDNVEPPLAFVLFQAVNLIDWSGTLPSAQFDELARAVSEVLSSTASGDSPNVEAEHTFRKAGAALRTVGETQRRQIEHRVYDRARPRDQWVSTTLDDFTDIVSPHQFGDVIAILKSLADSTDALLLLGKWDTHGAHQMFPSNLSDDQFFREGTFQILVPKRATGNFKRRLKIGA